MSPAINNWKTVTIGDLGQVVTGGTPSSRYPELFGTACPFITPTDIDNSCRYIETERFLSEQGRDDQSSRLLPPGTVCVVCIGATIGKICMTNKHSFTNQQINSIIVNKTNYDNSFVFYLLRTKNEVIKSIAGGAATPIVNKTAFSNIKVVVPYLPTQRKIAAILSAYDDLIENINRRLKILEEMAQLFYREWFVNFRFPGHENVNMIDSPLGRIPEDWSIALLGDVADIQWGDTSVTKKSYSEEGYAAYSASGLDGKLDYFDFDRDGIVLSAIGANCGITWYANGRWSCIKNTIRFWSSSDVVSTEYLYYATIDPVFWPRRGAAQPFISQGDAQRCQIIIPNKEIMRTFSTFANKILQFISSLTKKNILLADTRNFLLPKLISGKIDVSDMDIDIGEVAA